MLSYFGLIHFGFYWHKASICTVYYLSVRDLSLSLCALKLNVLFFPFNLFTIYGIRFFWNCILFINWKLNVYVKTTPFSDFFKEFSISSVFFVNELYSLRFLHLHLVYSLYLLINVWIGNFFRALIFFQNHNILVHLESPSHINTEINTWVYIK